MDAAWAQAVISGLAILASGGIAVFVPWRQRQNELKRERRQRLSVTTSFNAPSGLFVRVAYQPEFTHVGIRARVKLLSPDNAVLHSGKFTPNAAIMADGTHFRAVIDGTCIGGMAHIQLAGIGHSPWLEGAVFLTPPNDLQSLNSRITNARIRVEIETDSREKLLAVTLTISAIDSPEAIKPNFEAAA